MNKNLSAQEIYDLELAINVKGYDALQVDDLLDKIIADYETYDEELKLKDEIIESLNTEIEELNLIISKLKAKESELIDTTSTSPIDIIKRLNRLEEIVFKKD